MEILTIILVDIVVLAVFGFIVYKVIQRATKNKILFLENTKESFRYLSKIY